MEKFILPEKWSIKVTKENSLTVGKYFGQASDIYNNWWEHKATEPSRIFRIYLNSHNTKNQTPLNSTNNSFSSNEPENFELTTEQFIKYVLNKTNINTKLKEDLELNKIIIKLLS